MDIRADVEYVGQRWPKVRSCEWLATRLGTANSRRRQYLLYRKRHIEKLSAPLQGEQSVLSSAFSSTEGTTAPDEIQEHGDDGDTSSGASASEGPSEDTSVDSFFPNEQEPRPCIPRIPKGYKQGPVECTLCHEVIKIRGESSWK